MTRTADSELSIHRTFVVQLLPAQERTSTALAGRVEHVASGRATNFASLGALLAFFAEVLRAESHSARRRE